MARKTQRVRELLAGTNYELRPIYEDMLTEFGDPPRGVPDECKFHWPDKPLAVVTPHSSTGRYIYVGDSSSVDTSHSSSDVTVIRIPDHTDG